MSNIAIIFAGGTGKRMNTRSKPKQFLELHSKPILVYTLEKFNNHPDIDGIVLVILESWIEYCKDLVKKFRLSKIKAVVAGGDSALSSQRNGLLKVAELFSKDSIVLIHDGVRPLITEEVITANIRKVKEVGSCITCVPAIETVIMKNKENPMDIPKRSDTMIARAPQSFYLKDILTAHRKSRKDGITDFIDSCSMMRHYGYELGIVQGPMENIKITTPTDFFVFRAMVEVHENQQIFGF